jgi:hypothetical protein
MVHLLVGQDVPYFSGHKCLLVCSQKPVNGPHVSRFNTFNTLTPYLSDHSEVIC